MPKYPLQTDQFQPQMMTVDKLKTLPSGDVPGKKVGDILAAKRLASGHAEHVAMTKALGVRNPVLINTDGVLTDGHHRVAAAEDAGVTWVPYEVHRA